MAVARRSPPTAAALRRSATTIELDGSLTRAEVADALRELQFDGRAWTRRSVLIDRDVRDLPLLLHGYSELDTDICPMTHPWGNLG
jgi:hypothetical protein